jgi:hypothetical protein
MAKMKKKLPKYAIVVGMSKCDKNIKTFKNSLEFQFEALPHDEDKKV